MVRGRALLVAGAVALPAGTASGQTVVLDPITVTAQKREENVKDVPISITTFDERQILDREIRDISDLTKQTPNFYQFKAGGRSHTTTLNMRGVSSANADFGNPTVGVFVDGVKRGGGYDLDFFDVERVEVLRGPQGTLYGGNTLGGAINVVNKLPGFTWDALGDVTIGRFGTFQERFAFGGPINDTLAFRLSGSKLNSNGYIENTFLGQPGETRDDFSGRAQLRWTPNANWDVNLTIDGFNYDGRFASFAPVSSLRVNPWKVTDNYEGYANQRDLGQTLNVNYKADWFQITSITGHRNWRSVESLDADYTPQDLARDRSYKRNDQWSQELRVASLGPDDARLKWLAGVYYSHEKQLTGDDFLMNPPLFGMVVPTHQLGEVGVTAENAAVFGQGTVGLTDKLFLTLGARYDRVWKDMNSTSGFLTNAGLAPGIPQAASREFDAFLPKAALEYRWNPNVTTYGTISRGYKPGGFQTFNPTNANIAYESQFSWNYEVGMKTAFFDNRLTTDLSFFYIDIKGEQFATLVRPNVAVLQNIGRSHSQGVEASINWRVTDAWEVFGSLGVVDARVDELDRSTTATRVGARPAYVPRATATIGTGYKFDNGIYVRVDNNYIGDYYLDFNNTLQQSSFNLVNAKIGYIYNNVDISVFGKNLLNKDYLVRAFGGTLPNQGFVARQGEPMTFGVVMRARL
jgi:iron complex outermembrane receptor protein